ncbi:hypothetical protein M5K25_018162 [Dendrobium thyrsiflorum]|uniref:Replication factor A C-terminal domain-containing protein n=1 Tax=Dendrobium thyrsiflorum TaxID=117978 RepID=A0ABD0UP47_DENTH
MDPSSLIKSLSLNQHYWSITAVITQIDAVRVFKSGQGKIQKLTLMDKEGSKIFAIMFNETIDRFHNILEIGKTYVISNGQIKATNKDFYNVNENFEIILNNISEIQLAIADNIEPVRKNLSVIEDIKENPNSPSDIILLVLNVSEVRMIYRHTDKKKIFKRDLQVFDLRSEVCTFTLWEALATVEGKQLEESKNEKTIILAKDVIGKNFNGFILSTIQSTTLEINPNLPSSKELLDLSNINVHQHTSSTFDTCLMTNLQNINISEHSLGEVKYYSTRVVIKGLNEEGNIWYNSCNTCKSKVFIIDDIAKCPKCSNDNAEYSLRYLMKLRVEDNSSTAIFTVFDNEVEQIIGMPVIKLEKIKASNIEDYNNIIRNICDKELIFSVKAQDKQYGNRTFRSITVQSIKENCDQVNEIEPKRIKLEEL